VSVLGPLDDALLAFSEATQTGSVERKIVDGTGTVELGAAVKRLAR